MVEEVAKKDLKKKANRKWEGKASAADMNSLDFSDDKNLDSSPTATEATLSPQVARPSSIPLKHPYTITAIGILTY